METMFESNRRLIILLPRDKGLPLLPLLLLVLLSLLLLRYALRRRVMRGALRVVAWIWIVISGLGGIFTVLSLLGDPVIAIVALGTSALLGLPGVVRLWLTKSKAPQD